MLRIASRVVGITVLQLRGLGFVLLLFWGAGTWRWASYRWGR